MWPILELTVYLSKIMCNYFNAVFRRWTAIILLVMMGFIYGGGYFWATNCSSTLAVSDEQTTCCIMDHCCCKPEACQCPQQSHLNMEQEGLAQLTSPDCSPVKKNVQLGFDTLPAVLPCVGIVVVVPSSTNIWHRTSSRPMTKDLDPLFRPPPCPISSPLLSA